MKILFCPCHYAFDGFERGSELSWAYNIADRIASLHTKSVVVTGFKNVKDKKKYRIIELQKQKNAIDLNLLNTIRFNLEYTFFARSILSRETFDIIHHVLPFAIGRTFNLSYFFKGYTPFIIGPIQSPIPYYEDDVPDVKVKRKKSSQIGFSRLYFLFFQSILKIMSDRTLKKADRIIVINNETKKLLVERRIEEQKIIIIPPGIDTGKFQLVHKKEKEKNTIEILSTGSLTKRKGMDVTIRALPEIVKYYKDIVLRIVGDGPQLENLKALVNELKVADYVVFEGLVFHNEMPSFYNRADIFVSMSRAESWGQMYLEAMSSGLPIITTKNKGSNEIIEDGKFGYLIEQEDHLALAQKILYLTTHRNIREKFGDRARKQVEAQYDWEKVVIPKYLSLFNTFTKK
jgi:glycosyltransferase involved in cell wall biosynthesis